MIWISSIGAFFHGMAEVEFIHIIRRCIKKLESSPSARRCWVYWSHVLYEIVYCTQNCVLNAKLCKLGNSTTSDGKHLASIQFCWTHLLRPQIPLSFAMAIRIPYLLGDKTGVFFLPKQWKISRSILYLKYGRLIYSFWVILEWKMPSLIAE